MEYVKIGKVVNTFGLKGELKIESMTDFVEERFRKGQQLYIDSKEGFKEVSVLRKREHKGFLLVTFKDLEDINIYMKNLILKFIFFCINEISKFKMLRK